MSAQEHLIVSKGIAPKIAQKAATALVEGLRRPVMASHGKWQQISCGYRHRILLKGDGKALLITHEQMNRYLSRRSGITK